MTTTFENAKAGDKVWDFKYGWGEVAYVFKRGAYPLLVTFSFCQVSYEYDGASCVGCQQTLFWDEIKFEVPAQPPRMKLIHGVEVPDIGFEPKEGEQYYYPSVEAPAFYDITYFATNSKMDEFKRKNNLCYPHTAEGKQAAILHAKAMLGIKEI
jgi:hypothetical protein